MTQDGSLNLVGQNLIDGTWSAPRGDHLTTLVDPKNEAIAGTLKNASQADVADAVEAARQSQWDDTSVADRLGALSLLIERLAARRRDFAATIEAEIGAPADFADAGHFGAALAHLKAYREALDDLSDEETPWRDPAHRVRYEPLGVAALITPWNWPLNQAALKVGAALAAGCPIVLKPSELTPRTSVLFADVMRDVMEQVGTPSAFNMVLGNGEVGATLARHPGISAVSFTGSTAVGRQIGADAGGALKTALLELGGKSPNILFTDCDVQLATTQGLAHCFRNGGQSCNAASRMIVEHSIYDEVVEYAREIATTYRPGIDYGPIITARHFANVLSLIEAGIAEGARLIAGGAGKATETGFFPLATVFADVKPEMTIWQREVFGPVLTITPFETEAEAIALANDTEYGLAGYVQTADPARADRVAQAMRVGMVQVNGSSRAPGAPFGGVRASGLGRESGRWGIRAFQSAKSISGTARA